MPRGRPPKDGPRREPLNITLERSTIERLDAAKESGQIKSKSKFVEEAITDHLDKMEGQREPMSGRG